MPLAHLCARVRGGVTMAVYVDDARHRYGRMIMFHMVADTTEELLAMADAIGVDRRHLQNPGTPTEHFDICQAKRGKALLSGAAPITGRQLGRMILAKRRVARLVCAGCGDSGFQGQGSGYGDVCSECGGQSARTTTDNEGSE